MFNKIRYIIDILFNEDAIVVSKEKSIDMLKQNTILSVENKISRDRINSLSEEDRKRETLIEKTKKLEYTTKLALSLESAYLNKIRYLELKLTVNSMPKYSKFVEENPLKNRTPIEYEPYKPKTDNKEVFISEHTTNEIIKISQDNGGINAIINKLSIYV